MAEHLSWLEVDEVVAGLAPEPAHLAGCERCRGRLAGARAARQEVLGSPEFTRRLTAVQTGRAPRGEARGLGGLFRAWAPVLGAALSLGVVLLLSPGSPGERLKGGALIEVRRDPTGEKLTVARVGDRVALALGGAGHRYGLVLALDASGQVVQLWPAQPGSGEVPPGAAVPLSPGFEVTAGSARLWAFFSDVPLGSGPARRALIEAAAQGPALEGVPEHVEGEQARASCRLDVEQAPR